MRQNVTCIIMQNKRMFVDNPPHSYSYSVILCKQTHIHCSVKCYIIINMLESARNI